MKKNLYPFALCLLLTASCNPSSKPEQQKEDTANELQVAPQDSAQTTEANTEVDEQQVREVESAQFCKDLSIEKFMEFVRHIDKAHAEAIGLSQVYELEEQDKEEEGLTYYRAIYGRDIEKGKKLDFGYELKTTTGHACYFQEDLDTSTYYAMCFANEEDAKAFFDKLLQYGVLECDGDYLIPEKRLQAGKPTHVESLADYNCAFQFKEPKFEDGFYRINIYPFE